MGNLPPAPPALPSMGDIDDSLLPCSPEDTLKVRDAILLCCAVYEDDPHSYLEQKGHRFSHILESTGGPNEGRFLIGRVNTGNPSDENEKDSIYYLALRGSFNREDWATNLTAWPEVKKTGFVHSGWYSRTLYLPQGYIASRLAKGSQVVITGHSLGAAVAQLVAMNLLQDSMFSTEALNRVLCITFAAPLVVTDATAQVFNASHQHRFMQFIHRDDIVPKVLSWGHQELSSYIANIDTSNSVSAACQTIIDSLEQFVKSPVKPLVTKVVSSISKRMLTLLANYINYKPLGTYYDVQHVSTALSRDEIGHIMAYSNSIVNTDSCIIHRLESYAIVLLAKAKETTSYIRKRPDCLVVPPVIISRIVVSIVQGNKTKLNAIVEGCNLYGVRKLQTNTLPICTIDKIVENSNLVSSERLSFSVPFKKEAILNVKKRAFQTTLSVTEFFSDYQCNKSFLVKTVINVPVVVKTFHLLDTCSFGDLLVEAFTILTLASQQNLTLIFPTLFELLTEIFSAVPVHKFLVLGHPLCAIYLANTDWEKLWRQKTFRVAFTTLANQLRKIKHDVREKQSGMTSEMITTIFRFADTHPCRSNIQNVVTSINLRF